MEKQELLTEGKFFHGFFIRKISLIVVVAGKDIRDFTDRNISERINVVYDVFPVSYTHLTLPTNSLV